MSAPVTSSPEPAQDEPPPSVPAAAHQETTVEPQPKAPSVDTARIARDITQLSVGVAVLLIALKAFAYGASGSVSILASLTDSALDLAASLATFFAVRWAAAPADQGHRYGRGKAEAMSALVQSGLILASSVFIGWEAIQRIVDPRPVAAGGWATAIILVSIVITAWLVWMQGRALKKAPSLAIAGDRGHYSADLAASVVVLIGVISGTWLAAPGLDAAAGLVVAIWLFWGAIGLLRQAADQLLDRAAPEAVGLAVTSAVLSDPRIGGLHALRTRMMGTATHIQMHVDLDPDLSLRDAHAILVEAEARIHAALPQSDVIIHADPRKRAPFVPVSGPITSELPTDPDTVPASEINADTKEPG